MAATIAKARGVDRSRIKDVHRLGAVKAEVEANTWRTFTRCTVWADGHGYVQVRRDGEVLHHFEFGMEGED